MLIIHIQTEYECKIGHLYVFHLLCVSSGIIQQVLKRQIWMSWKCYKCMLFENVSMWSLFLNICTGFRSILKISRCACDWLSQQTVSGYAIRPEVCIMLTEISMSDCCCCRNSIYLDPTVTITQVLQPAAVVSLSTEARNFFVWCVIVVRFSKYSNLLSHLNSPNAAEISKGWTLKW